MGGTTPDSGDLEAWIGFPDPPHRLRTGRARARLTAGTVLAAVLFLAGLALLAAYFGFDRAGRGLLLDTALAAGLGAPLPGARVSIGSCEYADRRAGSPSPGHWVCTATVTLDRQPRVLTVESTTRFDLRPLGAGTVLDQTGLYWPPGMLAARWRNVATLAAAGVALMAMGLVIFAWLEADRRLLRARQGRLRVVDLLTWRGRPWFAFPDDRSRIHFQRADAEITPLVLDGLCSRGAALVAGRSAVLLDARLRPLELPAEQAADLLDSAGEVLRNAQKRVPLPAQPGDPPTLMRRIERVENEVAAEPGKEELARLYEEAWRLAWDSDDEAVSARALRVRDAIAKALGPRRAYAALQACRRRYGSHDPPQPPLEIAARDRTLRRAR